MLDQVTGMRVFVRVAASGSLAAAGRTLSLSQTMVTKHVDALEARLGVRLLHRTTRRLTLTEAGRTYLEACSRILAEIEEANQAAAAGQAEPRGTLRMNVPVPFGLLQVAPLLADFSMRHPMVLLDVGFNDRLVDLIEEGWDLAVRIGTLRGLHPGRAPAGTLPHDGVRVPGLPRHPWDAAQRCRTRRAQLPRLHALRPGGC